MIIQYNIVLTIANLTNNGTSKFSKVFETDLSATGALLYNNYHILSEGVYVLDMFDAEVSAYCTAMGITKSSIEIDEFEIVALTERTEVFFESVGEDNSLSLKPIIKCYVLPKYDALKVPSLTGVAYDSNTIIWSWPNDEGFAHYLVTEAIDPNSAASSDKIIAQLPIGAVSYTETGLDPNTAYTRRLINYTDEQTSSPSPSVTITTETAQISQSLEQYTIPKNYDFTTDDNERELIQENLEAFHSGVGDFTDLKVYKQMDADFYQKFKAYFELTGRRIQREKRYDQVGFYYKICLEAQETIEEQEGEVTFDIDVYPREWVSIQQYMYASMPVLVYAKLYATILLRKEEPETNFVDIEILEEVWESGELVTDFIGGKIRVVFVLDATWSIYHLGGGSSDAYRNAIRQGVVNCIDDIEAKKVQVGINTGTEPTVEYNLIVFTAGTHNHASTGTAIRGVSGWTSAGGAKDWVDNDNPGREEAFSSFNGYDLTDGNTSWYGGFEEACNIILTSKNEDSERKHITLFFSDGFPNTIGHSQYGGDLLNNSSDQETVLYRGNEPYDGVLGSGRGSIRWVAGVLKARCDMTACIVYQNGAYNSGGVWHYNDYHDNWYNEHYSAGFISAAHTLVGVDGNPDVGPSGTKFDGRYFWTDLNSLTTMFEKIVQNIMHQTQLPDVFKGFTTRTERININSSIDSVKAVNIESALLGPFEFNKTKTPIFYNSKEKRATMDKTGFIRPRIQKISTRSVYDLLLDAAKLTPEWGAGYNLPVGTTDGSYIIKGLHVKDTYAYADEDVMTSATFNTSDLEDGMTGTVNVYTDVDKAGTTTTFGDDCYLVSQGNYVYIDGYTDGIIYDGTRYVSVELNAYNRPSEILIDAGGDYSDQLYNRKNENINYSGSQSEIDSVVTILEIDEDIYLTGYPNLVKRGDILYINDLTNSLVAHIDVHWESPILNYRFNLEDPDAKTPYYEILPKANPQNNHLCIVLLHVYYAKNVWITNYNNYVALFGDSPIATESTPYMPFIENMNSWSMMEWRDGIGQENSKYVDSYLWFQAKPMLKTQDYYDELPGKGMDTFYGLVNGRYRTDNQDGKKDLIVDTPQFNIPTTVHKDTIRIYAMITESHPKDALISYKWEHPWNSKDDITVTNGDYITFRCDSLTYKDVEYYDVICTINKQNQEIFNQKTTEVIYAIEKPETIYTYLDYYLKVGTDNSDVIVMRYPTQITFDENGEASVGVSFKGVINATSQWAPRIHNGYYYLNQHEYFAYSEFDVIANFDTIEEKNFKTINGYLSLDVKLRHLAKPVEQYSITKDTRSELLQDEDLFQWVDDKGVTLKPIIDGEFYREYLPSVYYSPIILFPNVLTEAGTLKVNYTFDDESEFLPMEVRSYNLELGKWSDWEIFNNDTVPAVPLSCGYQVRFTLQASVQNFKINIEDYMCCYLDWKDDMNPANTVNIVTITDHMTTGPDKASGVYVSRVIDYGCKTSFKLDIFDSYYKDKCQILIAYTSDHPDKLLLENIVWSNISTLGETVFTGRYFRYKIIIPQEEKLYWLHKRIETLETHEILPYVTGVTMTGTYAPADIVTNFINTEAFNIPRDGALHTIFDRVIDVIGADVTERGFTKEEIEAITIQCTTADIRLDFDQNLLNPYPTAYLNTPIKAVSDIDFDIITKNTPYIFTEKDGEDNDIVIITGTPQQYCPITVEDVNGNSFIELHDTDSFTLTEEYTVTEVTKYIELKENRYDPDTFEVYDGDILLDIDDYRIINHLLIFNDSIEIGHTIKISYEMLYCFIPMIDRINNITTIYLHTGQGVPVPDKVKVYFETGKKNNKFVAKELSLNPIYRTDYKGFIYLTDEHNEPYDINIHCNPMILKAGGFDKVDIVIEVLDIQGNPVISKDIAVDCSFGILNCDSYITDMNGVIHIVYESAYMKCSDKLTARTLKDDNTTIEQSIIIINE